MNDYQSADTEYAETLAARLLDSWGIRCARNNLRDITAVDIVTDAGVKIDAQFSRDFAIYGDFRLDIISAFAPREICSEPNYAYNAGLNIIRNFELKFNCQVRKVGKIMQPGYLDMLMILFYNNKFIRGMPDKILLAGRRALIAYIKPRVRVLFESVKLNTKYGLDDEHGSAFIPLNVQNLINSSECIFGSPEDLSRKRNLLRDYVAGQA